MHPLFSLSLAILVAAVVVFVASSLIHMTFPWHKNDFPRVAAQDEILAALQTFGLAPGDYMIPRPSPAELKDPALREKIQARSMVLMTIFPPGPFRMGRGMGLWFVYVLALSALTGFFAFHVLGPAAPLHGIIHISGFVAWLAYAAAVWPMSIWYRRSWKLTLKATLDGFIYAALTAVTFALLWPH